MPPDLISTGFSEPMASSPLWLEYSGLPELLNDKVSKVAWLVFKKIIEIDCAANARPATIEITPAEIAQRCGLDAPTVMRTLEGLRKRKCLALFLPDHPEETALLEIKIPLPVPKPLEELRAQFPFNHVDEKVRFRYSSVQEGEADLPARQTGVKKETQRIIDLYFNNVGFKMNSFILDELHLLSQRFAADEIEKAFDRARKNDIRSLGWVAGELYRRSRKHERSKT